MPGSAGAVERSEAQFRGLRLTADEFLQLPDDGYNYELIDGVVMMSPSPTPQHQRITMEIAAQIAIFLRAHPVGEVLPETDVHLGQGPSGGDLVYRPEVIFVRSDRLSGMADKINAAPDLVVAVVSRGSRRMDTGTKRADYERFGVGEYWVIDPDRKSMTFWRLSAGRFLEVLPAGDSFTSQAIPGFSLDLARVREKFKPWQDWALA